MIICKRCVLTENYPNISFDSDGICNFCNRYASISEKTTDIEQFETKQELKDAFDAYKKQHNNKYDVLVPLSGGVDSSVALIEMVERYGLKPLGFHNDHGYESEIATSNVRKLCNSLNVDLLILQQDYQFMKKMWKYLNEVKIPGLHTCFVCGNILYANALELAMKYNISLIINGYSKGQIEVVKNEKSALSWIGYFLQEIMQRHDNEFIDIFMAKMEHMKKQKKYLSKNDLIQIDYSKITIMPFYTFNFYRTDKEILKSICQKRFDWRPQENSYPARTTNCLMNWLNNYYDNLKWGYTNYHPEYSQLIRAGEITREQALKDLKFDPPDGLLNKLAEDIEISLQNDVRQKPH